MKETQMSIPYLFRCPISLDLLQDPVTLCTGQTYDRSSIEKWLATGNLTCPVTMQKLHNPPTIVPNHTLLNLIQQWLKLGTITQFDPIYLQKIDSLVSLKRLLESHQAANTTTTLETKLGELKNLQVLVQDSPSVDSCLLQLGFLPLFLNLLFDKVESNSNVTQESIKFKELVLWFILRLLPLDDELESLSVLKEESIMASFVSLFENGNDIIKKGLCQILEAVSLSSSKETKELFAILGKNRRILQEIVSLIHQDDCTASSAGIIAISALCCLERNRENLVREGVVNGLVLYISKKSEKANAAALAMARLEQFLEVESAKECLLNNPKGIDALVKMVFRVSDHEGSESAIKSLLVLCSASMKAREKAVVAGVLTQLLLLLQSQCNGRTKTKARLLLRMLRSLK